MSEVTVYFATNRMPAGKEPPTEFLDDMSPFEGRYIRFGSAVVKGDPAKDPELEKATVKISTAKERLIATSDGAKSEPVLGSAEIFREIWQLPKSDTREVLIFIHGFWNSFEDALKSGALFSHLLDDKIVFVLSWPSEDRADRYPTDFERAEVSGVAMSRAFLTFMKWLDGEKKDCKRKVHLLAHSMGSRALRFAVQNVRKYAKPTLPRLLDHVILAAADEDADALSRDDKLKPLTAIATDITVYHTPNDLALKVSNKIKLNPDRLGTRGPDRMTFTDDNVFAVDVTKAVTGDGSFIDHWFHKNNPSVVADIRSVLRNTNPYRVPGRTATPTLRRFEITV